MTHLASSIRRLGVLLMIMSFVALSFGAANHTQAQGGVSQLRFVHAVANADAVDVTINGQVSASKLLFGNATRFLSLAPGVYEISILATGTTTELTKLSVELVAGGAKTAVIAGLQAVVVNIYEEDLGPIAEGKARVTAIHAVAGGPAVSVGTIEGGALALPFAEGLNFGADYGSADLDAAAFDIGVFPDPETALDKALATAKQVSLIGGTYNSLLIIGALDGSVPVKVVNLVSGLPPVETANTGLLRLVHGNAEAPAVDIYVGDKLVAAAIKFGTATPHLSFPATKLPVAIRIAGSPATSAALFSAEIDLSTIAAQTVVIAGTGAAPSAVVSSDNTAAPLDPKQARVHLINAITAGEAALTIGSATLSSTQAAGLDVPAAVYPVVATAGNAKVELSAALDGGVLYDAILIGTETNPQLVLAATGLTESIGSAAGAAPVEVAAAPTTLPTTLPTTVATVAAPTVAPTTAAAVVVPTVAPTLPPTAAAVAAVPTDIPALAPTVDINGTVQAQVQTAIAATALAVSALPTAGADQPTELPVVTDEPPPAVTAAPASGQIDISQGLWAVVATDEGVNLKLREYPRDDAKTLALAPSGATLEVVGLRGPPAAPLRATPTDQVRTLPTPTLSYEGVDPTQIWLFITWTQADGEVTGWTKANFLRITKDGELVISDDFKEIFKFPLVPETTFGEVKSGAVTPIASEVVSILGTVVVDPGVRLQVRRTPNITGESLALLDNGTEVVVLQQINIPSTGAVGEPSNAVWFFIQFTTNTGSVTGYVNSDFLRVTRRGRAVDLKDIPETKEPVPGQLTGSLATVQPTRQAGLTALVDKIDPNANLQLRRTPNAQGESLGLIPAGTQVQVIGRNGDGNWLFVNFNGTEGWINAFYVSLSKNGRRVKIEDVTNITTDADIAASITPGPSPTVTPAGFVPSATPSP